MFFLVLFCIFFHAVNLKTTPLGTRGAVQGRTAPVRSAQESLLTLAWDLPSSLAFLRILRVFRLVRIVRLVRTVQARRWVLFADMRSATAVAANCAAFVCCIFFALWQWMALVCHWLQLEVTVCDRHCASFDSWQDCQTWWTCTGVTWAHAIQLGVMEETIPKCECSEKSHSIEWIPACVVWTLSAYILNVCHQYCMYSINFLPICPLDYRINHFSDIDFMFITGIVIDNLGIFFVFYFVQLFMLCF